MAPNLLEEIAARFVPGDGPVVVEASAAGLVNESYRVVRHGESYSLRIAAVDSAGLGVERAWECAVLERASAAGLAPSLRRCDPAHGILVADWVSGRAWSDTEVRATGNIDAMARLLNRVHALAMPSPVRRLGPAEWIAHYRSMLDEFGSSASRPSDELAQQAAACLEALIQSPAAVPVLCHSDLHRLNVLVGERVLLLDWEYSHASHPFWDLAAWASNNDWTMGEAEYLLTSYHARAMTAAELDQFGVWAWLHDYVCLLWSELYLRRRPGTAGCPVAQRAELLAQRLQNAYR